MNDNRPKRGISTSQAGERGGRTHPRAADVSPRTGDSRRAGRDPRRERTANGESQGTPRARVDRREGASLRLRKPLERVIAHGHPWVYRDALEGPEFAVGMVIDLLDQRGTFLARGLADSGPIGMRVLTRREEVVDLAFFAQRIDAALTLRAALELGETTAMRLINGEGDRLPGLICDRYGDFAVVAFDGGALAAWGEKLQALLFEKLRAIGVKTLLLRHGRGPQRSLECLYGERPAGPIEVKERGMTLVVDLDQGQKTGLFLDHRESRAAIRSLCTRLCVERKQLRVLNLYGYTGGFSVAAGLGGAFEVVTVDASAGALEMATASWVANGLNADAHRVYCGKAEAFLEDSTQGEFDIVIADPPSFAPNQRALAKALGAYRAMHRSALARVRDGGYYLTASCSSHVDRTAFEGTLREAAHGARVELQILGRWSAGADHPVPLGFVEGDYLCVVLSRVAHKR